jgi:hypothetical protein
MSSSASSREVPVPPIRVVVTCSERKTRPVPQSLHVRTLMGGQNEERCGVWTTRLDDATVLPLPAYDLYCGDHWSVAKSLVAGAQRRVELWVASAGYGLVPASAPLKPYAATFTRRHPDSVVPVTGIREPSQVAQWWSALSRWTGPSPGSSRSITQLAASAPGASLVVVASAAYLAAMSDDLIAARAELTNQDTMAVVCVGAPSTAAVWNMIIPADARLQFVLGGARQSLNVRLARYILEKQRGRVHFSTACDTVDEMMRALPPPAQFNRATQSDHDVLRFIRRERLQTPNVSCSKLLRTFRDQGFACEQHRFGGLFNAVQGDAA